MLEKGHGSTFTLPFTSTTQPTNLQSLTQGHLRRAPLPETLLYLKGTAVGLAKNMTSSGTAKSLWPDMSSFTFHWHQVHASQLNDDWTDLALYNGVTIDDLFVGLAWTRFTRFTIAKSS